ncbi:aminoglycoside phosphotransferase family protein [Jannaschia sp. S6380]|uniref:phosphotransferase n=1 Tax=Jannaschia sp. S6380 TaxID=2926408 RepID=UPI001FF6CDA5|nr:aminoglycoside phosphotransferase family protein [Jannaschia sp. S6380]MCK0168212.1 aminoglycoside phosphotransferase family protein [Jannaschia sp. S6380]
MDGEGITGTGRGDPLARVTAMAHRAIAALDLPPDGWSMTRLGLHDDDQLVRAVLRLDRAGLPSMVVKAQLRPANPAEFASDVARNAAAYDAFPRSRDLGMPEVLWRDDAGMACATRYIPGLRMSQAMRRTWHGERLTLLTGTGRWLAALHRSGDPGRAPFHPRGAVQQWRQKAEAVRARTERVAARPLFLGLAADLRRRAGQLAADGPFDVPYALPHGDAHLGNFIRGEAGGTWGFDLYPHGWRPVAIDVAKLLTDFTTLFHFPDEISAEHPIPPETLAAFMRGYDLLPMDDPALDLLVRAELLRILSTVPADPARRSHGKTRTLDRLLPILKRLAETSPGRRRR